MEFDKINISEMEKQRYNSIKEKGKYLELNVLVGGENESIDENGLANRAPVVTTTMCDCGTEEIACLYATLEAVLRSLEKRYPIACIMSKIGINVEDLGSVQRSHEDEED